MESSAGTLLRRTEFETISRMVYAVCGISLAYGKEELVKARLGKRLRALGLPSFREYLRLIDQDASRHELAVMVELLTTNKTSFFRESQHFDFLRRRVLPALPARRLRIWSAACSSGEEPYSISMTLRDALPEPGAFDARILATDISRKVLEKAKDGVYGEDILRDVPPQMLQRHFACVHHQRPRLYRVNDGIRARVRFAALNLLDPWPMRGPFDVIFCRNVMIYFDKPTQQRLILRFWDLLRPGGYLFVGHSESLAGLEHEFRYIQPAVHLKPEA